MKKQYMKPELCIDMYIPDKTIAISCPECFGNISCITDTGGESYLDPLSKTDCLGFGGEYPDCDI